MLIGLIVALLLFALAYALSKTTFGSTLVEWVKLIYAAARLLVFVAIAFLTPKRRPAAETV